MRTAHNITFLRNIALSTVLAVGLSSPAALAFADSGDGAGASADASETTDADEVSTIGELIGKVKLAAVPADAKPVKDETVYVFADAAGTARDTLVKDQISNTSAADELHDASTLQDIEAGGDASLDAQGTSLTWKTGGDGVSYEGRTDADCPVKMKVTYKLDGKEVPPDEIAGATGHITIRFDFENASKERVDVDGAERDVYTPFVCITGFSLDNSRFSNIEVTNAKATADGDSTTIAGYAMPGMQENLGIDEGDFDFPSYFEVSADAAGFELGTTTTVVANGLFSDLDADGLDTGDVRDGLTSMSDAMAALIAGTSSLYDGLEQLAAGTDELGAGAGQLADGSSQLADGASALAQGTDGLAEGLDGLAGGAQSAAEGSAQVSEGAAGVEQGASQLAGAMAQAAAKGAALSEGLAGVDTGAMGIAADALSSDSQSLSETATSLQGASGSIGSAIDAIDASTSLTDEEKTAIKDYLASAKTSVDGAAAAAGTASTDASGAATRLTTGADAIGNAAAGASALSDSLSQMESLSAGLSESSSALSAGAEGVAEGTAGLASGTAQSAEGASRLSDAAGLIAGAAPALSQGIAAMEAGSSQLSQGMHSAADGSLQLAGGLQQFDSEGVQALIDAYDDNLGGLSERLKAVSRADERYDNFSGIDPSMTGSVKFIYQTDEISAE